MHLKQGVQSAEDSSKDAVHPLWRSIIALDSTFCLAFDRKPMSFHQTGYTIDRNTTKNHSFSELMHEMQTLRLDWQLVSSNEPQKLLQLKTIDRYISGTELVDQLASDAIDASQQATSIPGRVEQLFYRIHMCFFKAQIYRCASVSNEVPKPRRLTSFKTMKENLQEVIQSFMRLKQLSPIPNTAWDVQVAVMSSALLLVGVERALETSESKDLLVKLCGILPHCRTTVAEDPEQVLEAPYCHGWEALKFLLDGMNQRASTSPMSA